MIPAINLGPFVLPTGPLTYLLGAWLCLSLAERSARRLDQDAAALTNLVTAALLAGFVGARLTFVALYWQAFSASPLSIIWPLNAGFNLWGGLFFGGAAAFFYGRYRQLPLRPTLDALAPVLVLALMTASLADFLGGPGFGTVTTLPWGIDQFGIRRHPVQLYELLVGATALLTWWLLHRRHRAPGQLFLATTAVYCFGRLFVDTFRENTWISAGGWHVVQILCLAVTLAALLLLALGPQPNRVTDAAGLPT